MKRSKHSLSHYRLVTCDMGKLVPVGLQEVLPGDTFQHSTSMLLRMSPLVAPVMHPVSVRLHHWFVPNRILWDDWEDFITGGKDGAGAASPYPTNPGSVTPAVGGLWDYLGVPTGKAFPAGALNLMPIQGYNMIYNEFYRDEDLAAELDDTNVNPANIAWEKDYFTAARPWSQKGPSVTLPIGSQATVKTAAGDLVTGVQNPLRFLRANNGNLPPTSETINWGTSGIAYGGTPGGTSVGQVYPSNLYADLTNAEPPDIIDVRRAFALQRYQEARAQYGSRYTEYLRYLGVKSSDARLQRPEYLGGGKQTVAFSEVLKTGAGEDPAEPIGTMKGHGIAAMRSNRYRYFAEEHGYIFTLLSIRPRSMYMDGLNRTWSRRTKEDYYQKELELIGQQEVFNREIFAQGTAADADVFGYNDRYSEYRHQYSGINGEFRTLLDYWHLARKFSSLPVLNESFIECDPAKRVFAEQTQHSCWIMVSHSIQARRLVGKNTIGRVI